ncbi:MAG: hypothetical protein SGCHY_005372 [Lobulomycetales sp.]
MSDGKTVQNIIATKAEAVPGAIKVLENETASGESGDRIARSYGKIHEFAETLQSRDDPEPVKPPMKAVSTAAPPDGEDEAESSIEQSFHNLQRYTRIIQSDTKAVEDSPVHASPVSRASSPRPPMPLAATASPDRASSATVVQLPEIPSVPVTALSPAELAALRKTCRRLYEKIKRVSDAKKAAAAATAANTHLASPAATPLETPWAASSADVRKELQLYRQLKAYLAPAPRRASPPPCQAALDRISGYTNGDASVWRDVAGLSVRQMEEEKSVVKREITLMKRMYADAKDRESLESVAAIKAERDVLKRMHARYSTLKRAISADSRLVEEPLVLPTPVSSSVQAQPPEQVLRKQDGEQSTEKDLRKRNCQPTEKDMEKQNGDTGAPEHLAALCTEKKRLQRLLSDFQTRFSQTHGRPVRTLADRQQVQDEYTRYKVCGISCF